MMKIKTAFLLVISSLLVACNAASSVSNNDQGPRAWVDMPLPGSQYTLEAIDILAHASAPDGVTALAFHVNGELIETISTETGSQSLIVVQHQWTPAAAGTYTLSAAARDQNDNWSSPSEVSITVLESLPEDPEFLVPVPSDLLPTAQSPTSLPPTAVPPTSVPPTPVPPTPIPPTPVPPTITPVPDTQDPVITSLLWNPASPNEDETVSFTVTATDNTSVARIEIYFFRQGDTPQGPIQVCQSTGMCEHQALSGFRWGIYNYYAIAYDPAGNSISSFTQTVQILQVVK